MRLPRPEPGFFKGLLVLAFPMMMQNLVTFSVGLADSMMVGSLGENVMAGVYLGNQLQNLLQTVMIGIDSAMLVLAAQYWGKKDTNSIKIIFKDASLVGVALALLFTGVSVLAPEWVLGFFTKEAAVMAEGMRYLFYLRWSFVFFVMAQMLLTVMRSVESVKIGMYSSFIALAANVVLNYVLIFGKLGFPAMGAAGAALATLISRFIEFAIVGLYVLIADRRLRMRPSNLKLGSRLLFRDFLRYGMPIIAGQVVWGLNNLVQGIIVGSMGAYATAAISMYGMCFQMLGVVMMALSGAVGITTGKLVGAGEVERVKNHARVVQLMYLCIGLVCVPVILLLRGPILSLYNITPETVHIARQVMTIFACYYPGTCYQGFSLASLVKAGGDTKFVFVNDSIFVWGLIIPSALAARYLFAAPVWAVFMILKADEILKCPVAFIKINRFNWIKNLTRPSQALARPAKASPK